MEDTYTIQHKVSAHYSGSETYYRHRIEEWAERATRLGHLAERYALAALDETNADIRALISEDIRQITGERDALLCAIQVARYRLNDPVVTWPEDAPWAGF